MFLRKRILIVDGVEMSRHYLRHILTNASYTTEAVNNAHDALKMAEDEFFDIFFIDMHLPNLDSVKLIKTLHEIDEYKSVPILALTTKSNIDSLRQKGETIGITDWFKKPVSPRDVLQRLKELGITNTHQVQSLV